MLSATVGCLGMSSTILDCLGRCGHHRKIQRNRNMEQLPRVVNNIVRTCKTELWYVPAQLQTRNELREELKNFRFLPQNKGDWIGMQFMWKWRWCFLTSPQEDQCKLTGGFIPSKSRKTLQDPQEMLECSAAWIRICGCWLCYHIGQQVLGSLTYHMTDLK